MKVARMSFNRSVLATENGIPVDLIKDVLSLLPSDTKFVGCGNDSSKMLDFLFFTSDCFVDVPDGLSVPDIYLHFRSYHNNGVRTVKIEKIDFGPALPGYQKQPCGEFHIWQEYIGFTHNYKVCVACGIKE